MSQEETPSVFVSKKVMCHLLIYKRNIENILKRAILNYFWLMLQYLFSCIRKDSFVEKKMYFSLTQRPISPFCTSSMFATLPSNRMYGRLGVAGARHALHGSVLPLLRSSQSYPVLLTHAGFQTPAPSRACVLRHPLHSSCVGKRS